MLFVFQKLGLSTKLYIIVWSGYFNCDEGVERVQIGCGWTLPFTPVLIPLSFMIISSHVLADTWWSSLSKRPPRERKVLGSNPACAGIFSGSSHTSDLNIGTPVAALPGAWHYRVSTGTGRPGVSILWLGEVEIWICSFYLSVAARKFVQIRPWDTLACCWDVKQPTNKQTIS